MLIDVILLLILLVCALSGYRRGLLMSLMSLVVIVLCCFGASVAQRALTPKAVAYMEPLLTETIQEGIETQLETETQQALEDAGNTGLIIGGQSMSLSDLAELLGRFGIDVEAQVTEKTSTALAPAVEAAAQAAAEAIAEQLAGTVIYFLAFLILYLVLHSIALAVNVVDRMPVIHTMNRLGGVVLGLLGGLWVMTASLAVLSQAGLALPEPGPLTRALTSLVERIL